MQGKTAGPSKPGPNMQYVETRHSLQAIQMDDINSTPPVSKIVVIEGQNKIFSSIFFKKITVKFSGLLWENNVLVTKA
jgi:hypothetical protein